MDNLESLGGAAGMLQDMSLMHAELMQAALMGLPWVD